MTLAVGEKVPYCSVGRETGPVLSVHSVTLAAPQCLILIDNWPMNPPSPRFVRVHCLSSASQVTSLCTVGYSLYLEKSVNIWFHINIIGWILWMTLYVAAAGPQLLFLHELGSITVEAEVFRSCVWSRPDLVPCWQRCAMCNVHIVHMYSHLPCTIAHVLQNMHNAWSAHIHKIRMHIRLYVMHVHNMQEVQCKMFLILQRAALHCIAEAALVWSGLSRAGTHWREAGLVHTLAQSGTHWYTLSRAGTHWGEAGLRCCQRCDKSRSGVRWQNSTLNCISLFSTNTNQIQIQIQIQIQMIYKYKYYSKPNTNIIQMKTCPLSTIFSSGISQLHLRQCLWSNIWIAGRKFYQPPHLIHWITVNLYPYLIRCNGIS